MFQPAPLSIAPNEVLRYLGGGHAVPPAGLLAEVEQCGQQLLAAVTPKVTWRAFPLTDFSLEGTRVRLDGQDTWTAAPTASSWPPPWDWRQNSSSAGHRHGI